MLTAHWLASSDTPAVREILDRCVVLLLPSHNPDGTQKVVEWYRKSLGTPHEGGAVPFLYHRYAGHDNNRDWYAFNLVESRLTVAHVYDRWRPQIVHDLHQMGTKGPRIFVPPYTDPYEPNVDPALVAAINALGTHVAARLLSEGKTGVAVHALFDGYSPTRAYPHTHGGVRFLSEVASARMATPLEVPFADLQPSGTFDPKQASWNFPAPWPGGPWTLRDIVDYELSATRAVLEHAAREPRVLAAQLQRGPAPRRHPHRSLRLRPSRPRQGPLRARQARGDPAHGRGGGAPRAGRLPGPGRGPVRRLPGRLLRRAHAAAVLRVRQAGPRAAGLSRPAAVPGRATRAPLRRHRPHPAPAHGG